MSTEQDREPRPAPAPTKPKPKPKPKVPPMTLERGLWLLVVLLVVYRVSYHATYLGEVPFAHATFSDGAVYEQAARDILEQPPLGTQPFYLQGAYAYLLALGMTIRPWPSLGLVLQLLLAFATLALFYRAALRLWGRRAGLLSSIALLSYPGLAFYENKYLSAELGIATNVLVIAAFVGLIGRRGWTRVLLALGLGLASGLAILARPNMVLAFPFTLLAIVLVVGEGEPPRASGESRPRLDPLRARLRVAALPCAAALIGCLLALAPMAARNQAVTGHPDIQPVHGGGTSFFIGNNPVAHGLWNDGGLLSGRLGTESRELAAALSIDPALDDRDRAQAIGRRLYTRSFAWIRANPGAWAKLELDKLWLTIGDQQLTQDYDWLGERELLPWANRGLVSFSMLLALGLLGSAAVFARTPAWAPGPDAPTAATWSGATRAALGLLCAGQLLAPLAANVLFFTSAQHRLPLVVPLALLAGPGLLACVSTVKTLLAQRRGEPGSARLPTFVLVAAALLLVQGPWPRTRQSEPHPVHYYNLAMVQDSIGEPLAAIHSLDRALEQRPEQPIFLIRRIHLRVRLADLDGAERDLDTLAMVAAREPVPAWVIAQARGEAQTIAHERVSPTRSSPR